MKQQANRLLALDILRGITIAGMILVNNPGSWGSIYAPLRHAAWNGLTPTDLVLHVYYGDFHFHVVAQIRIQANFGRDNKDFASFCGNIRNWFGHCMVQQILLRYSLRSNQCR